MPEINFWELTQQTAQNYEIVWLKTAQTRGNENQHTLFIIRIFFAGLFAASRQQLQLFLDVIGDQRRIEAQESILQRCRQRSVLVSRNALQELGEMISSIQCNFRP